MAQLFTGYGIAAKLANHFASEPTLFDGLDCQL